jgi:SAM-dependent methyltransferase
MKKSKQGTPAPLDYDFDVHPRNSFMYNWVKQYMDKTYEMLREVDYDFAGKTIYDIGIGRGRTLAIYKAMGVKKVIGYDLVKEETDYAVKQAKRLSINLEIVIDTYNNDKLKKLPDKTCEVICVMNILFCAADDRTRKTIINEIKRLLKPGGLLIVTDMQKLSLMWFFNTITRIPRKFHVHEELVNSLRPLKLIATGSSNYFYFVNKPADFLGELFGSGLYSALNSAFQKTSIPASTRTLIFKK